MPPDLLASRQQAFGADRQIPGPKRKTASEVTLSAGLRDIGLSLAPDRIAALEHFLELLQRWNRVY
ncbi:MAG: hypothetical protein RLZ51_2292, partial [Pseudomonadota bacterium]